MQPMYSFELIFISIGINSTSFYWLQEVNISVLVFFKWYISWCLFNVCDNYIDMILYIVCQRIIMLISYFILYYHDHYVVCLLKQFSSRYNFASFLVIGNELYISVYYWYWMIQPYSTKLKFKKQNIRTDWGSLFHSRCDTLQQTVYRLNHVVFRKKN